MHPEFDMDGCRFHPEPTEQDWLDYEAFQRQSAEWMDKGLCLNCGSPSQLVCGGVCETCMNEYCAALSR